MNMNNNNSIYDFLNDLVANQDGSFDYGITNRILDKYNKKIDPKTTRITPSSFIISDEREAA